MDLLQTLRTRRSPALNTLVEPGPTPAQLDEILTIAARVPDHGKLTPWRFIVIEGEARQRLGKELAAVWAEKNAALRSADGAAFDKGVAQWAGRMSASPAVVVVVSRARAHPKIPEWEQVLSAGACCMNMLLAAKGLGFGALWISEWYAYDARVLGALGLAPSEKVAGFVHIGTVHEDREDRERPSLDAVVTRY